MIVYQTFHSDFCNFSQIVHINGAVAKISNPDYNNTSRQTIQLNIYSNTEVRTLGTYVPDVSRPIPTISLSDPGKILNSDCRKFCFLLGSGTIRLI